ncbi:hypothetical protein GOARA_015_00070 [Gordonia araii NBRC 100433]|uniref:Uncharacterized protein n=1 Tax=Gordonia araii NBRC 100433 TaxID=1073574 RepID=G7GYJ4_9ACTN|nr:hypothetical protein [Gordonia araii]NNG97471.1 hypothetical protein [Gordonia araii NBRC 100433]GAB08669.1 hypothetical protein GOARA_015_00070 [Gordonia araii NBRC 100433]
MADLTKRSPTPRPGLVAGPAEAAAGQDGRYAQFTYTSFDAGAPGGRGAFGGAAGQRSSGGGWQVKQVVGDLAPGDIEDLTARIVTRFDLEPVLPGFPTPEQIAARPSRLVYSFTGDRAAYWHTVDAGRDGTGRPGNVFAHVLADGFGAETATAPGLDAVRPVELWRWTGWLRPYGPEEVKAAVLPASPPALTPNPSLSAEASVGFLLDPARDRTGLARVLLDAVAARLSGDATGPVVLAVDDHDHAAAWIAAISHFLTAGGARRFSWSTHDAPESVAAGSAADLHLVAVPRDRRGEVHGAVDVVVDEHEEPYLGDPGSAHRLAAGSVPVTGLSVLAEAVLADEETALRVFGRRDEIAAQFEDVPGTSIAPEWPIAVALLEMPELAEFHADAAAVIVDDAPPGLTEVPWAAALVDETLRTHPPTADEALRRLARAAARGRGTDRLAQYVLGAALADSAWLDRCDLAAVPTVRTASLGESRDQIGRRCAELTSRIADDPSGATRAALRTAELIERLAVPDDERATARDELAAVVARTGLTEIGTPGWSERFDADEMSEATRATMVRPVFARHAVGRLSELSSDVALWLYGAVSADHNYACPDPALPDDDYLFGFATRAVLSDWALGIPAPARAHYASEAIRGALRSERLGDEDCRDLVSAIVAEQRPPAADLLEFSKSTGRVPPQVLDSLVFYGDVESDALQAIVDMPDAASPVLAAAAWLRLARRSARVTDRDRWCTAVAALATSAESRPPAGGEVTWVAQAAEELVVMAAAGFVVGQSSAAPWADPGTPFCAALKARMPSIYQQVVDELGRAEQEWVLDTAWVAGHALTVMMGVPGAGAGPLDGLGSPSLRDGSGGLVPWSQRLIEQRLVEGSYRGPSDIAGLRDAGWLVVRALDADAAEYFFADYRRGAADWAARAGVGAQSNGGSGRGPSGLGGLG